MIAWEYQLSHTNARYVVTVTFRLIVTTIFGMITIPWIFLHPCGGFYFYNPSGQEELLDLCTKVFREK